jgi:hypothetical protein
MLLEGAASLRLAPCHTAAPRPARVADGWPSRRSSPRLNGQDTNGAERVDVDSATYARRNRHHLLLAFCVSAGAGISA